MFFVVPVVRLCCEAVSVLTKATWDLSLSVEKERLAKFKTGDLLKGTSLETIKNREPVEKDLTGND